MAAFTVALCLAGLSLALFGLALIYEPAAYIAGGGVALRVAFVLDERTPPDDA